jgi:hypothetical protein
MTARTYPDAARGLGCAEEFLRRNIRRLPHHKIGRAVAFHDDDMDLLRELFAVRPAPRPVLAEDTPLTRRNRHLARRPA